MTSADCAEPRTAVTATVLSTDARTGESLIQTAEDAATLLGRLARGQANILITGRPGSGKSTLLRTLAADAGARRFRFYFDLGLKPRGETFPEYAARLLSPCMTADRSRAYDLFLYLIRSGSALCVLDAVDEGVDEASPAGFLRLFADLAPVLSAESTVVMSSRVSFLADSPQIRQLLDSGTARSEQLVEQMYANGLDPARVPHFHLVRLAEPDATPLEMRLTASLQLGSSQPLDALLGAHITKTLAERGQADTEERLPAVFGGAFLTDQTVFSLLDLHRDLGPGAFNNGRLELNSCVLAPLLRPAGPDQVAFVHTAYQELLAARFLATPTRAFLARIPTVVPSDDCLLPAGVHLVGPAERLLLRRVRHAVRFDRHAVTVGRYRRFLDALRHDGTSPWDHPDQPDNVTHTPWADRLRESDYYRNARYDDHPAICVSWWSAFAFAAFEGKRLPTALEWEAAARGTDGRLFPWGDESDGAPVNCADTWVGHPVVTFHAWQQEFAQEALRRAWVTPVGERPANRSPYGITDMSGNVWEWTTTSLDDAGEAVICGGSYDNPLRAVQASSKGIYRKRG